MLTSDFDYGLPDELIAQRPAPRGESRMMVLAAEEAPIHARFVDLPDYLDPGDLLVVNDTRVIPARLFGHRAESGGRIELLLVEKMESTVWVCLAKPGRKALPGSEITLSERLSVTILEKHEDGRHLLRFSEPVEPHLEALGTVPLPPYIKRAAEARDETDYQTIFATEPGAIAAPTAGLHFTDEMKERLGTFGVEIRPLTLHVGIGTFKPVNADLVHEHSMDPEHYAIPAATARAIERTRQRGGRVIAVGTTVVRALEGAAQGGPQEDGPPQDRPPIEERSGMTDIFIRPGHRFRVVEALLTNFHLPRSTLLMLVSAFAGRERILAAYREAVEAHYRFFSYGDAMLLLPHRDQRARDLHRQFTEKRSST